MKKTLWMLVAACMAGSCGPKKVQDEKALPVDLSLFSTTKGYTWGTIGICVITFLLYALLW